MENLALKIAVELHQGEKSTKKIWRFDASSARSYTRARLEKEIETLFPHIPKKGCTVKLYHYDELAGKVLIESDIDAIEALNNFIEEHKNSRRPTYMVLHAEDSVVELPSSSSSSSKTIPRKVMLPHLIRLPLVCLTF